MVQNNSPAVTKKRSYDDGCAAAHALDLVGERWALLVLRELLLGPKRFTALRAGLPTVSPNVLTQRLNELEAAQVLRRRKLPPPASAWAYELTDWGRELEAVILQLVRWGVKSPTFQRGAPLGTDAMVLSFQAMFNPPVTGTRHAVCTAIEIHLNNEVFSATIAGPELNIARGSLPQPLATVSTNPQTLLQLAYGKANIDDAVKAGSFSYTGERQAIEDFFSAFTVPDAVSQHDS